MLAATNRPDILDPALLRPGRFDVQLEIPLPDVAGRREIFRIGLRGKPLAEGIRVDDLAEQTEGFTGAEVRAVCTQAAWDAVREVLSRPAGRGLARAPGHDHRGAPEEGHGRPPAVITVRRAEQARGIDAALKAEARLTACRPSG